MNEYGFDELKEGMTHEFTASFSEQDMGKFLEITGDINPLHNDSEFALKNGFKDKVVYGLLTQSLLSRLSGVHIPGKHSIILSVKSDFMKPVFCNDKLKVQGKISRLINSTKMVFLDVNMFRGEEKVLKGEMILKMAK